MLLYKVPECSLGILVFLHFEEFKPLFVKILRLLRLRGLGPYLLFCFNHLGGSLLARPLHQLLGRLAHLLDSCLYLCLKLGKL